MNSGFVDAGNIPYLIIFVSFVVAVVHVRDLI